LFEAIILGIIQGLTEFFPVSSTGHLILFTWFFKIGGIVDTLSFDVALHLGTLVAVVVYFYRDWIEMMTTNRKLFLLLVIATIPAGLAGYFLNDIVESVFRSPIIIAAALISVSCVMWASERFQKSRDIDRLTVLDAVIIGIAQILALIPGVSRSGITISAGLFRDLRRETATRFSFLMSTPIIAGATTLHMMKIFRSESDYNINIILAGVLSSGIAGFFAIRFLMNFFRKHSLNTFVYYRIGLGILILTTAWLKG
jgi:undecaprenyl-diphosphatase